MAATLIQTTSSKVFGTTELLEMVLLRLPLPKLLCAQGVCQAWRDTIKRSPTMQKRLFFIRDDTYLNQTWLVDEHSAAVTQSHAPDRSTLQSADTRCISVLNPFICRSNVPGQERTITVRDAYTKDNECCFVDVYKLSLDLPTSSRRQMLLTQPPVKRVRTRWFAADEDECNIVHNQSTITNPEGVTFSQVLDDFASATGIVDNPYGSYLNISSEVFLPTAIRKALVGKSLRVRNVQGLCEAFDALEEDLCIA